MSRRSCRDLLQRSSYRFQCLLGLGAVGSAALGHVGPASATLPAQSLDSGPHKLDRADLSGKIVGDADGDACPAFINRHERANSRAQALLHVINSGPQTLRIKAFHNLSEELEPVDVFRRGAFGPR